MDRESDQWWGSVALIGAGLGVIGAGTTSYTYDGLGRVTQSGTGTVPLWDSVNWNSFNWQ